MLIKSFLCITKIMFHVKQLFSNEILSNPQAKSLQCKNNLKNPAKKQEIKNNERLLV